MATMPARSAWRSMAACLLLAVAACGGGGGGGSTGGTPETPFTVSLDRSTLDLSWSESDAVPMATVKATTQGTTSSRLYVGTTAPGGQADANIDHVDVMLDGTAGASVTVFPAAGLAPGRHTGTLVVNACLDTACARHAGGSPFTVTYSFTVQAVAVVAEPRVLDITAFISTTASQQARLPGLTSAGGLKATPRDPWLTASFVVQGGAVSVKAQATADVMPGTRMSAIDIEGPAFTLSVPVTLHTVASPLILFPDAPVLTTPQGGRCAGTVLVTSLAYGAAGYTVSSPVPWLDIAAKRERDFDIAAASLPPGTYQATLTVRSGAEVVTLPVSCRVNGSGAQGLVVARPSVTLMAAPGGTSDAVGLAVVRPDWDPQLQTSVSYGQGQGWLAIDTAAGGDLQVRADATSLARGTYDATVTVSAAYPSVPVAVPVRLTVGDGLATPAPKTVVIGSDTSAAGGLLELVGSGTLLRWNASTTTPWLRLASSSGNATATPFYTVDMTQVAALPAFIDIVGQVALEATLTSGAPGSATATVTLRRELAELTGVTPSTVVAGQPVSVVLRGRGFDGMATPASRISAGGAPVMSVTRLGDTGLAVQFGALAEGPVELRLTNALGVPTTTATLNVVAPRAYPAAALPTGGRPVSLVGDAQRRQVFAANPAAGGVQRWRERAGAWVADQLAVADLADIALRPDGTELLATSMSGRVYVIDPVAFTVTGTHDAPAPLYPVPRTGHGIAVTNDHRLWLTTTAGPRSFDLRARRFETPGFPGVTTQFNGGPWFEVSRDGEHLWMAQGSGLQPPPPALLLEVSTGRWQANPAGLDFFFWSMTGLDDSGSRLLMMGGVWDRDFRAIGRQWLPASGWLDAASVLSPDGRRLYLFALPPGWATAGSDTLPQVWVFDTSQPQGTNAALPLLGAIPVPAFPTCRLAGASADDCRRPPMAIAADGRTLFVAGEAKLLVLPVPAELASP